MRGCAAVMLMLSPYAYQSQVHAHVGSVKLSNANRRSCGHRAPHKNLCRMQASRMTPQLIAGGTDPQGHPSHLPGGIQAGSSGPQQASTSLTTSISLLNQAEAGALQLVAAEACCLKVSTRLSTPSALPPNTLPCTMPTLS